MSRILEKPFDATKKIIRSIFRGAPNVITTSDLNRQIEALKAQMDMMCDFLGCTYSSNLSLQATLSSETLRVTVESVGGGNTVDIWARGVYFRPSVIATNVQGVNAENDDFYVFLTADNALIKYEDDPSHEISGAKFADGTSLPAADNYVFTNEKIIVSRYSERPENVMANLANITLKDGKVLLYRYFYNYGGIKRADEGRFYSTKAERIRRDSSGGIQPNAMFGQYNYATIINRIISDLDNGIRTNYPYDITAMPVGSPTFSKIGTLRVNRVSKVLFVNATNVWWADFYDPGKGGGLIFIENLCKDYTFTTDDISAIACVAQQEPAFSSAIIKPQINGNDLVLSFSGVSQGNLSIPVSFSFWIMLQE